MVIKQLSIDFDEKTIIVNGHQIKHIPVIVRVSSKGIERGIVFNHTCEAAEELLQIEKAPVLTLGWE